jgi:hypothetical protein
VFGDEAALPGDGASDAAGLAGCDEFGGGAPGGVPVAGAVDGGLPSWV